MTKAIQKLTLIPSFFGLVQAFTTSKRSLNVPAIQRTRRVPMNEQTAIAPAEIEADFVFRCYDNSMVNVHLFCGDLVFIRACDDVEDGKIAVVRMGESVALRRVYHGADYLELRAENPECPPIVAHCQDSEVEIIGAAVKALCSVF